MKNLVFLFILIVFILGCENTNTKESMAYPKIDVKYPPTKKLDTFDVYHGDTIIDPYRWLEDDRSAETEAWVQEQNKVTQSYLSKIPFRKKIEARYRELFNYPKLSSPYKVGEYYFFERNDGLQNQAIIYKQKGLDGQPEVFIDPNQLSEEGTTAVSLVGFSKDHRYATYSTQEAGSDWQGFKVMEVETGKTLEDELEWVKFSSASWYQDGFFYARYPAPEQGKEYTASNDFHSVYYHKIGTPQTDDRLILKDQDPKIYHSAYVTEDEQLLVVYQGKGSNGYRTLVKSLSADEDTFRVLQEGFDHLSTVIQHEDGKIWVRTNLSAPNYKLIQVSLNQLDLSKGEVIVPERKDLLESVTTGGGFLFANYLEKASNHIYRLHMDGTGEEEIKFKGMASVSGFSGQKEDDHLFYVYTSFTRPPTIYKYDIKTSESSIFFQPELTFQPEDYVEKQVFYESKDGTQVSMFIVHKKDLALNGNASTYLYAYGGFNVNLTPSFSSSRMLLLENDGVYAMPNLRGGGEYGEDWHKGGMLENKQNVFDDFIAAAEYLIDQKYTSSARLAIAGGSNGGLLVGACMTQRPELFAVAFPAVGVLDMLRYHKFTIGWAWIPEYGSSEDPEQYQFLKAYSPYHNLEKGVDYPATLVTTADHDDRVVPAHSFKYAARLQEMQGSEDPVLIRIETDAGHGAGKPTSKIIEEQADIWSFFFYNTQSDVKY